MEKMDILRDHLHELMNTFFEKFNTDPNLNIKTQVHEKLACIIFSICLDTSRAKIDNSSDPSKTQFVDSNEQDRIDESKFYYFDLIFKHFGFFEEKTKNLLLKIYLYKLLDGKKFKELTSKQVYGPLTKEEYRRGYKYPEQSLSNPLLTLLQYSFRTAGAEEHDCILEFVKILNSKVKSTLEISHLLLKICIKNDDYEDVLKETFDTTFKIPNVKKNILMTSKENDPKPEICILLCALLEQTRSSDDSKKSQNSGRKTTHSVIIKSILELPKERIYVLDKCISSFKLEILIDVLHDIVDLATDDNIVAVLSQYKMIMRSIIIVSNYISNGTTNVGYQQFLEVIYKLLNKGAWKDAIQWKGIKLFMSKCKDKVDTKYLKDLPQEQLDELSL